jgi:hypothetical protein
MRAAASVCVTFNANISTRWAYNQVRLPRCIALVRTENLDNSAGGAPSSALLTEATEHPHKRLSLVRALSVMLVCFHLQ